MGALDNAGGVYLLTLCALALLGWAFLILCDWARTLDRQDRAKKVPASGEALTGKKDGTSKTATTISDLSSIAQTAEESKGAA